MKKQVVLLILAVTAVFSAVAVSLCWIRRGTANRDLTVKRR